MGEKDIAEKTLEAYNDVFAHIVNVLLFDGKRLIQENELETNGTISQIKIDGKIHEQERDVSKIWKNGEIRISILGFENQTIPDADMPLRVMSYDGASYKQQLLDDTTKQRYPVITLVLYFGEKHWNKPKTLLECIKLPDELKPFASDYKINVFEIAWLDDETINKFTSDFKFVAQFFQSKRKNVEYKGSDEEIKHVDEIFKLISVLNGDKTFELRYNEVKAMKKGGAVTMCDVVKKIEDAGIVKGKEEAILNLLEANAGTIEQIAAWLKLPVETVKEIAQKVPVLK